MNDENELLDYEEGTRPTNPERYTADGGKRFLNYILDRVGLYILFFGLGSLMDSSLIAEDALMVLILILLPGYFVLTEYFWGKTPAKFITRTTVVTLRGTRPSILTIIGRTLCRLIPFEQFSFLGSRAVGWHDSITSTRVVSDDFFKARITEDTTSSGPDLGDDDWKPENEWSKKDIVD